MIFEMKYLSPVCHLLSEREKKSVKPQTYTALGLVSGEKYV